MDNLKCFREKPLNSHLSCFVSGVGVGEIMNPGIVNRPHGTGDWLLMFFHSQVEIRDGDGIGTHPSGSFILWSDEDVHHYGSQVGGWSHSWVHFQGRESRSMVEAAGLPVNSVIEIGNAPESFFNCLRGIYGELTEEIDSDDFIIANFLRNALAILARFGGGTLSRRGVLPSGVAKAKKLMDADPSRRFTLDELSKAASLSPSRFSAEFKRCLSLSPVDYLIRNRMRMARYMLEDRNKSISEVAFALGYSDIFHFSKQFKKRFGIPPSKMR